MEKRRKRPWPQTIDLVVFDFDGVFTDNRVWITENGEESVACYRGDGLGLAMLRERGVPTMVLSTESNPVVAARCDKLNLTCRQDVQDKVAALRALAQEKKISLENVMYVGNDINDLGCLEAAGYAVAPADAYPAAIARADLVLRTRGGYGAVRELCELIIQNLKLRPDKSLRIFPDAD